MSAREKAESVVRHWRFSSKHLDSSGNPRIRLEHNEHWDLVDQIEKAIDTAIEEVTKPEGCC